MLRPSFAILLILLAITSLAQKDTFRLRPQQLSPNLRPLLEKKGRDSVDVVVVIDSSRAPFINYQKFRILDQYKAAKILKIKVRQSDLKEVLQDIDPQFASLSQKPKEELTTGSLDIRLNKINYVHSLFPQINGDSIVISIKEQQFDTSDIDYRNRHINSGLGAQDATTHASVMATIAAGAANTSPFAMGAAPAAKLTSSSFASLLPDPDSIFRGYQISVQNHSYGTAVESFYGNEAYAYDVSTANNPSLLPIFSSGNSGDAASGTGKYAGLTGFANLTGNFKQAKNILTAGAVDSFRNIDVRSSKGPAFDGRVKPEVVAFGADGSSGGAAMVSGAAALVQQAFKQANDGLLPEAALVKAIIINSADDVGNPNVDYSSGYGSLNAWKAVATVLENRFIETPVANGQVKTFPITIPEGTSRIKVTVSWADAPALPNASKALVNDVDALLLLPATNESWLPWVLSSFPHADSLTMPARRKRDTLNNTEQITIDQPLAGSYLLQISGTRITRASQKVFAVIQLDTANYFRWTYPAKDDMIISGAGNIIRWQTDQTTSGKLEYSFDGNDWQIIASDVLLANEYFNWQSPDVMRKAFLRMTVNGMPSTKTDTFVISRQVQMDVGFNCEDSFLLHWNELPFIDQYQLYRLGDKYLEAVQVVRDTFVILDKTRNPSLYYAVAPIVEGREGLKSFTINYTALGVGCYFKGFFIHEQHEESVVLRAELGSLYHIANITLQKQAGSNFNDLYSVNSPGSLSLLFPDSLLSQGIQYYRLQLRLINGAVVYSEVVPVIHFTSLPVVVFPNPVAQSGPLNIINSEPGRYYIEIIDLQGRKIKEYRLNSQEEQIFPRFLRAGVYFIRILNSEGKVGVQKLVVY